MGTFAFKLPDIGEGVVEGEVVEWMVAVGDTVKEDDPILSVMTDKATVEIPAPCDGTVTKIIGDAGDILPVGVVCIEFEVDGDGNASASEPEPAAPAVEETPEPVAEPEPAPAPEPTPAPEPVAVAGPVVERAPGTKPLAAPAVRQRARDAGVDLYHVAGLRCCWKNHACRPRCSPQWWSVQSLFSHANGKFGKGCKDGY